MNYQNFIKRDGPEISHYATITWSRFLGSIHTINTHYRSTRDLLMFDAWFNQILLWRLPQPGEIL